MNSPLANNHLPLFLIGYRGTGKTTVARIVAQRLGWHWRDADTELEQQQGRSIREIFAQDGEAAFRDIEAAIFAELCTLPHHVVATGGGIILRADNRQRLKDSGIVVWLTADAGTLWQRLQVDPDTKQRRPDLTVGGLAEIEGLLQVREPLYAECAHFVVDTVGCCPEDVAKVILDKLAAKP